MFECKGRNLFLISKTFIIIFYTWNRDTKETHFGRNRKRATFHNAAGEHEKVSFNSNMNLSSQAKIVKFPVFPGCHSSFRMSINIPKTTAY